MDLNETYLRQIGRSVQEHVSRLQVEIGDAELVEISQALQNLKAYHFRGGHVNLECKLDLQVVLTTPFPKVKGWRE